MPFKSQAQRRKFAELLVNGEISPDTFEEWNRETGSQRLPERVKKKKTKKKKTAKTRTRTRRAKATRPRAAKRSTAKRGVKRTTKRKRSSTASTRTGRSAGGKRPRGPVVDPRPLRANGPVDMPDLETPRLVLRLPQGADAQPLLDIHEHPEVIKHVVISSTRRGITAAWSSVAMMIGHWQLRGYGQWTVIEKATGCVIGRVGLWNPEGWPGLELGWVIRHSRWGNGFATEAARASLAWAWQHVDTDHIISIIDRGNVASIRVAEKIGERFERTQEVNAVEGASTALTARTLQPTAAV